MAQLQSTSVTGSIGLLSTTPDTGSSGNLWYNTTTNKLEYSYFNGSFIVSCSFTGAIIIC